MKTSQCSDKLDKKTKQQLKSEVTKKRAKTELANIMKKRSYTEPLKADLCLALRRRQRTLVTRKVAAVGVGIGAVAYGASKKSTVMRTPTPTPKSSENTAKKSTGMRTPTPTPKSSEKTAQQIVADALKANEHGTTLDQLRYHKDSLLKLANGMEDKRYTAVRGVTRKEVAGAMKVVEKSYKELYTYYKNEVPNYQDLNSFREIENALAILTRRGDNLERGRRQRKALLPNKL
jgi:hypothetical protein